MAAQPCSHPSSSRTNFLLPMICPMCWGLWASAHSCDREPLRDASDRTGAPVDVVVGAAAAAAAGDGVGWGADPRSMA